MTKNINFLKGRVFLFKKRAKQLFIIEMASFGLLVVYGLIVLAAFAYLIFLKKENTVLKKRVADSKEVIIKYNSIEAKQVYLKRKIKSLVAVLDSQKQHQRITDAIFNLLPEGILISGFDINEVGGVSFSARSESFKTLKSFFSSLETNPQIGEMKITKAQVEGVNFSPEEGYSFQIYLLLESTENG